MLEVVPILVSRTDQSGSVMFKSGDVLAREDAEVHLHAFQMMTESSSCVNGDIVVLEDCIVVRK
jgi:hypothetical protein